MLSLASQVFMIDFHSLLSDFMNETEPIAIKICQIALQIMCDSSEREREKEGTKIYNEIIENMNGKNEM